MQLSCFLRLLAMACVLTYGAELRAHDVPPASLIPVAVLCGGDDGLTSRLCDQLELAFRKSIDFTISLKETPKTLKVKIPTNLDWKKVAGRIKAFYTVEYLSVDDKALSNGAGSCWEDRLGDCAKQIVQEAREVSRRTPGVAHANPGPH